VAYYTVYKRLANQEIERLGYVELEEIVSLARYKHSQALTGNPGVNVLWDKPSGPSIGITPLSYNFRPATA
jgi:hypothetical protein